MRYFKHFNRVLNENVIYKVVSTNEWYFTLGGVSWLMGQGSWKRYQTLFQLTEITPLEVLVLMGKL